VLVSLLTNTIVVPAITETVLGTKLFGWLALPAPSGMVISTVVVEEGVPVVRVESAITVVEDVVVFEDEVDVAK
jgi:hypothetical protein